MNRIVIVGGSVAGIRTAQALRAEGFTGELVVLEASAQPQPYDKPPLSKAFLAPGGSAADVELISPEELASLDVTFQPSNEAVALHPTDKTVELRGGERVRYDVLVVATGARARRSPWGEGEKIHVLRTYEDAERLRTALRPGSRIVVVGAGFIGAEVASTAVAAGAAVTVVDPLAAPMTRVLSAEIGGIFGDKLAREGVKLALSSTVESIAQEGDETVVTLGDGTRLPADAVVVGIGAQVNTEWLAGSGVELQDGVVCGADLRVAGVDDVYAVGDVARWPDEHGALVRMEHWTSAVDQALLVARNILDPDPDRRYRPVRYVWSDQFDWRVQLVGRTEGEGCEVVGSVDDGRFAILYGSPQEPIRGAVTVNWPKAQLAARRAVSAGQTLDDVRNALALAAAPRATAS